MRTFRRLFVVVNIMAVMFGAATATQTAAAGTGDRPKDAEISPEAMAQARILTARYTNLEVTRTNTTAQVEFDDTATGAHHSASFELGGNLEKMLTPELAQPLYQTEWRGGAPSTGSTVTRHANSPSTATTPPFSTPSARPPVAGHAR